jgi:hypothetical protein
MRPKDRDVLLWRYFESRSVMQIAQALGISEHAASKRVTRAVDRLREFFARRGVTVTAAALGTMLLTNTSEAAPAALIGAVSSTATLGAGSSAIAIAKGAVIMAATSNVKAAAIAAIVALMLVGGGAVVVKSMASNDDVAPDTRAATTAPTPGTVTFTDGTVARIVAIAEGHDRKSKWWTADGSPTADPAVTMGGRIAIDPIAGLREIQLVIDIKGTAMSERGMAIEFTNSRGVATSINDTPAGRTCKVVTALPSDRPTADMRIGLSGGPWTDTVIWRKDADVSVDPDGPIPKLLGVTQENGETLVEVTPTYTMRPQLNRRMVVMVNGSPLTATNVKGSTTSEVHRFGCRQDQIERIVYGTRPLEWQEMKNVSIVPKK